jgi:pimeloyl-ACP methyl ester carboxylesterase
MSHLHDLGEHDTALGLELTEGYDGLVDDFTLRRLPQASHWVQQDAPNAVNAAVAEWLAAPTSDKFN